MSKDTPHYLTGTPKDAFTTDIPTELLEDFDTVKDTLCSALGDTPSRAAEIWWSLTKGSGETYEAYCTSV